MIIKGRKLPSTQSGVAVNPMGGRLNFFLNVDLGKEGRRTDSLDFTFCGRAFVTFLFSFASVLGVT